ncbi:MAG: FAD-binding oxidoreductase [Methylobacteriaceae bacterium]|nr:FAD-binding oxidoreductase [Methylobacteriaceae bacterium]
MTSTAPIAAAETVIVGAGIVGCSLALHLARLEHRDVIVLERGDLADPLGSSGHAPGLLCRNSASPTMSALAQASARLYGELPGAKPALTPVGSLEVTRERERLPELQVKLRAATANGLDARLVTPMEAAALVPYLDPTPLAGGIAVAGDGAINVRAALRAIYDEAAALGVSFRFGTEVLGFQAESERVTGLETPAGTIACHRAVLAVGIWGRVLAGSLGLDLPLVPVQHPYLTTGPLPALAGSSQPATHPILRDLDRRFYLREHEDRLGYGWYNHAPLAADVAGLRRAELAYADDGFAPAVPHDLVPALREAPVAHRLNGIFSITPDGGPLLGPVLERPGLWLAEAVWVTHAGGVGAALAEMMLGREPAIDLSGFGLGRFAGQREEASRAASLALYNDIYAWPAELPQAA